MAFGNLMEVCVCQYFMFPAKRNQKGPFYESGMLAVTVFSRQDGDLNLLPQKRVILQMNN